MMESISACDMRSSKGSATRTMRFTTLSTNTVCCSCLVSSLGDRLMLPLVDALGCSCIGSCDGLMVSSRRWVMVGRRSESPVLMVNISWLICWLLTPLRVLSRMPCWKDCRTPSFLSDTL